MACWNGLSERQQAMLIIDGVLAFGHWPAEGGSCERGAEVAIECEWDVAPGPRFYCRPCAVEYLSQHH